MRGKNHLINWKLMNFYSFKTFRTHHMFRDHIYSEYVCMYVCMYELDLALINQKALIWHKTQLTILFTLMSKATVLISCHHQVALRAQVPWISFTVGPYHPSLIYSLQDSIVCLFRTDIRVALAGWQALVSPWKNDDYDCALKFSCSSI